MSEGPDQKPPPATVCVTGASSQLGVFLLPRLASAGFQVAAVSRNAPSRPLRVSGGVVWLRPDVLLSGRYAESLPGPLIHLVSCGPLSVAREIVPGSPELRRVVAFSSSSVVSKAGSPDEREARLVAGMAEQERELARACSQRGLPLLLLRPTLIYGCGRDRNVSLLAGLARRLGFIPLAGAAGGRRQPVHADDLAELALRALIGANPVTMTSEVCGGSTLTYRAMAERIAHAVRLDARVISLPAGLMAAMVRLISVLPGWRGLNPEMVRRQSHDLVFDDSELRRALDWAPRPFEPGTADFEVPEHARSLQMPPE